MARYRDRMRVLKPTQLTLGGGRALALQAVPAINKSYTKLMGPVTTWGVEGTLEEASHQMPGAWSPAPCGEPGPFWSCSSSAPHVSTPGSITLLQHQHPVKEESWAPALNYELPQRGDSILTNLPQKRGKERTYVIATLGISYGKSKGMSNAARKTLHLNLLCLQGKCQQRGVKHGNLTTSLFRDITKDLKCIQNAEHAFFKNILVYNMKASLSTWINCWLVLAAEPWVLTAQQGAGVTEPCPVPSTPFSQGSGLSLGSSSQGCTRARHSCQLKTGCLYDRARSAAPGSSVVPLFSHRSKALQKNPCPYTWKWTSNSSIKRLSAPQEQKSLRMMRGKIEIKKKKKKWHDFLKCADSHILSHMLRSWMIVKKKLFLWNLHTAGNLTSGKDWQEKIIIILFNLLQ